MKKILIIILLTLLIIVGYRYLSPVQDTSNDILIIDGENKVISSEDQSIQDEDFGSSTCYQYRGTAEGYEDNREITLDVYGTTVTGVKSGYSNSNEYSVGYTGTIEGELDNLGGDSINAITTLVIADGGANRQEEIYVLGENSITEMRYRLVEDFEDNILRIDKNVIEAAEGQIFPIEYKYEKIDCSLLGKKQEDVDAKDTLSASRYICFTSDDQNSNKLMFGLDEKENALFAQYKDQEDTIELNFVSKDFPNPGYPTYTLTYNEIVDGNINGTYVQTHSGNYDYLKYTDNEGKVFNFTNILEESYINNSCL